MSDLGGDRGGTPLRLVCFELDGQELAIPIGDVGETLPLHPITPVFLTPPFLAGVFSLRGDIVPVIDLAVLLALGTTKIGTDSRIVVIDHRTTTIAIVVDRLRDLRVIEGGTAALEPPPAHLSPAVAALFAGVSVTETGSVRVLDAAAIINSELLRALASNGESGAP
ncbi:MAG: chemotaxis protein CheW [Proteobacteria bacterium]|nr:chemotaxis protein CheW [Pseudomonadota bacterium]